MANLNLWILVNKHNIIITKGRRKEVLKVRYHRYVYNHIYDDKVIRTELKLNA